MNKLYIAVFCDCDPDRPLYSGKKYNLSKDSYVWNGVGKGIPKLKEIAREIKDSQGNSLKFNWCIRSDPQMREVYGKAAWPVVNFLKMWGECAEEGDEIAWHPHLWRWDRENKYWHQEVDDEEWMAYCLEEGYKSFTEETPFRPVNVRMGWDFHNNFTMKKLDGLGLTADFSALPAMLSEGVNLSSDHFIDRFDWQTTSSEPYYPALKDYRRPAEAREKALNILEFPVTTFSSRILAFLRNLRSSLIYKSKRNTNKMIGSIITLNPLILQKKIRNKILEARAREIAYFVGYFHADELLKDSFLYSLENLKENMMAIKNYSKEFGIEYNFLTAKELVKLFKERRGHAT
jgi:hypothetical protein